MSKVFLELKAKISALEAMQIMGRVQSIVGMSLTVVGLQRAVGIGARCVVKGVNGPVMAEVVGADETGLRLLPFGSWDGVAVGDPVELVQHDEGICPDNSWIGTVVDGLGRPLGDAPQFKRGRTRSSGRNGPPPAFGRRRVGQKLQTQIKCIDVFTPLCQGQRMGVSQVLALANPH